jgi:hypothetical protein
LIIKWNKTYNLSAIRTMEIGVKKHLLDCLSIMPYVDESTNVLEIGAGMGENTKFLLATEAKVCTKFLFIFTQ